MNVERSLGLSPNRLFGDLPSQVIKSSFPVGENSTGPDFLLQPLLISPHPLICEKGERCKLPYIYQHYDLVNHPLKKIDLVWKLFKLFFSF